MVGASVVRCIQAAQRHGPVVIVTDSDENWVRDTAKLLSPGSWGSCLKGIEIVSSRERFGADFPGQPACWHIAAFSYVTNRHLLAENASAGLRRDVEGEEEDEYCEKRDESIKGAGVDVNGCGDEDDGKNGEAGGCKGDHEAAGEIFSVEARDTEPPASSAGATAKCGHGRGTLVAVATAPRAWQDKSATRTLREHHPDIAAKTVSLIEGPSPLELKNQLDLLSKNFELMFGYRRDSRPAPAPVPLPLPATRCTVDGASFSPSSPPYPAITNTPFLRKPRHHHHHHLLPASGSGSSMFGDGDPCLDDYATPTTTSSTVRSFEDDATVISTSSEKSAEEEEDEDDGVFPIVVDHDLE